MLRLLLHPKIRAHKPKFHTEMRITRPLFILIFHKILEADLLFIFNFNFFWSRLCNIIFYILISFGLGRPVILCQTAQSDLETVKFLQWASSCARSMPSNFNDHMLSNSRTIRCGSKIQVRDIIEYFNKTFNVHKSLSHYNSIISYA